MTLSKQDIITSILKNKLMCDNRGNLYGDDYLSYTSYTTGMWQFPDELAEMLLYLQDKKVESFLNIGTFNGLTFNLMSDFFNIFRKTVCITLDPFDFKPVKSINYIYESKTSIDYSGINFDFVFIDGDHSYKESKKDYDNVGKYAKYCAFHDIDDSYIRETKGYEGGIPKLWEELKAKNSYIEFNSNKKNKKIMGIGLIYDKKI